MERLTLDEAIKYTKEIARANRVEAENYIPTTGPYYNADLECANQYEQISMWLKELKSYKDTEEQGLLVRLPVAIGDDIYKIPSKANYDLNVLDGYKANNRVYHQKVYSVVFSQRGWFVQCDKDSILAPNVICVDVEYGRTWFLTREEAERKLEEMKKNAIQH